MIILDCGFGKSDSLCMKHIWRLWMEEPYRLFFPLGMLAGISGVMMWPMLYAGMIGFYPGDAHPRVMLQGFMAAFVLGFIGTAFPRLCGTRGWGSWEFSGFLILWSMAVSCAMTNRVPAGDVAFSMLCLLLFAGMLARWWGGKRDIPPPGFVLAFAGVAGAAVASACLAWDHGFWLGAQGLAWMKLLLYQGFPLLPMLGIGPYLLPRFFGKPSGHSFDESPTPPPGWWPKFYASVACGLLVIGSFALEVYGLVGAGHLLRALVVAGWFALETPVFRRAKVSSTPGNAIRWAIGGLVAGCVATFLQPAARIGTMHLFFAAGIALVTMAVATRVILGHAGRHDLLTGKITWLRWAAGLLVLAAATRVTSDFFPAVRVSHHIYAAWSWALGALIWLFALAGMLLRKEVEEKPKSNCSRHQPARNA